MKQILTLLLFVLSGQLLFAQNVGIGTNTPNSKAILDISSTTRGILTPRMTTLERLSITSPPNGLLVYDLDKNEFYHYTGTGWLAMLNGAYWTRPITNRNRISNNIDSVGIGTNSPTEWLDVDGNIRSRNNVLADNNITATGTVQGSAIISTGNLVTGGTGLVNGDLSTNSGLFINNTAAILQLKSSGISKGFLQLAGSDVRLGTNSGNTGNLIIRMNGNDRIRIDQGGNMDIEGQIINSAATGAAPLLPRCYGYVSATGAIISGSGNFTVTKTIIGEYRITCTGISTNSIFFSSVPYQTAVSSTFYDSPNNLAIRTWSTDTGIREDHNFYFIVFGL